MTLWKGRIDTKSDPSLKMMNDSLKVDIRLLPYDIRLNSAWADELEACGVLNSSELKEIKKALENIRADGTEDDEDVHSLVERKLTELVGDAGKKIHTGKSRNDQVVTDLKLYLKDSAALLVKKISSLSGVLVKRAEDNISTVMPGYTHMQQAQPISLAHYLMSFVASLDEDVDRLNNFTDASLASCPLGSGALAGTTLRIDRERLAKKLGFKNASVNSIQSVSDRAFVIELASVLAMISMHLSRYAEDMIVWSTRELGFIELGDNVSTGSSMMPQKKNPDSLELIRGATGATYGNLMGLLTICKGVPLSYAKDLQDDKRFIFDSIDNVAGSLELFATVISGVKFNAEKMRGAIDKATLATDMADELVKNGTPFREAHEKIAAIVKNNELGSVKMTFEESISRRCAKGGTSPDRIKEEIKKRSS